MSRRRDRLLMAAVSVAVLFGSAGTAHADTSAADKRYADLMTSQGMPPIQDLSQARAVGLNICAQLKDGTSFDLVATRVMQSVSEFSLTRSQARSVVADAQTVYCPTT